MSKTKTLRLTLEKSLIGTKQPHRDTVRALGMRKIRQTVERENTPEIRGMVNKIAYLLKVEEIA